MWRVAVKAELLGVGTSLMMDDAGTGCLPNLSTLVSTMSASARTMTQTDSLASALRHGAKIKVTP